MKASFLLLLRRKYTSPYVMTYEFLTAGNTARPNTWKKVNFCDCVG